MFARTLISRLVPPLLLFQLALLFVSCNKGEQKGYLHIAAPKAGTYEVYSILGSSTLEFVAEHVGKYNEDIALPPGRYLLLGDCSHRIVSIYPGEHNRLTAHMVNFLPPLPPQEGDVFTVQCSRYEKSNLRQQLHNRFSLFLVDQAQELLVGMVPLAIKLPQQAVNDQPQVINFPLAAVKISADPPVVSGDAPYFVSPVQSLLALTQAQSMDRWQFFLPGDYRIDLNGSSLPVSLGSGEIRVVKAAGLRLSTSPKWNAETYTQVKGSPFHVEFNEGHMLLPDITYPVLPGVGQLSLVGESVPKPVELQSNAITEVKLHSVMVESGCSPWEWDCLGKREVSLYREGEQYPFLESVTDVPIPYFEGDIYIGVEGSTGLRYHVGAAQRDTILQLGKVVFVPQGQYRPGHLTDLVRLEAQRIPYFGYSYDIVADGPSTLTVIAGTYTLSRYFTTNSFDGSRSQVKQNVTVRPGGVELVEVPFFLPEAKAAALQEKMSNWAAKRNRQNYDLLRKRQEIEYF